MKRFKICSDCCWISSPVLGHAHKTLPLRRHGDGFSFPLPQLLSYRSHFEGQLHLKKKKKNSLTLLLNNFCTRGKKTTNGFASVRLFNYFFPAGLSPFDVTADPVTTVNVYINNAVAKAARAESQRQVRIPPQAWRVVRRKQASGGDPVGTVCSLLPAERNNRRGD